VLTLAFAAALGEACAGVLALALALALEPGLDERALAGAGADAATGLGVDTAVAAAVRDPTGLVLEGMESRKARAQL
jgi:hypothetical protein